VGSLYGLRKGEARSRTNQLLESLNLKEAADRSIGGYSAGMKQRLGLAQALIGDPRLLILDEPTANLDPLGRAELLEMIKALHRDRNVSFVIASHVLPELQKICDQVGVISRGVMLEQGSVADLTKKYAGNTFKVEVSNSAVLMEELRKIEFVEDVSLREGSLWIRVREPDKLYDQVSRIVRRKKLQLQVFQQASLDFEELFMSLLGEEGKEEGGGERPQ
jgi:ABC-2 type transport system ATP-binding protein